MNAFSGHWRQEIRLRRVISTATVCATGIAAAGPKGIDAAEAKGIAAAGTIDIAESGAIDIAPDRFIVVCHILTCYA